MSSFVSDFITNCYTLIVTAIIIVLIAIHYKLKFCVWSSRGVVGPKPLPIIVTVDTFFDSLPNIFVKQRKKYGRVYGSYDLLGPTLVVTDPKVVKQVCVKDFHIFTNRRVIKNFHKIISKMMSIAMDNEWKRMRKTISPTFSTGKIKRMKPLIEECIVNAVEYLEVTTAKKEELNIKQFWSRFTLEVIARCCFATNVNSHKDPDNEFFKHVTAFFTPPGFARIIAVTVLLILPPFLAKRLPFSFFSEEHVNYLSKVTLHLLKQRREASSNHNDFLQLLVEAEKENEDKGEPLLSEDEIIGNCILFFVAGYETTANLLSWTFYLLAMNPEVQEKLFNELKSNFTDPQSIDYDLANKLPYLDAVVCETLRMYPPLISIERTASTEVEIECVGVKIPAKTAVMIPLFAMHRDSEYFPEPDIFKPERFLDDNCHSIDPYSYLPFGSGPRNCVAMRFALIEAKLAIIQTVLNFKVGRCEKTPEKPEFVRFSAFCISKDIFVNVIKREK